LTKKKKEKKTQKQSKDGEKNQSKTEHKKIYIERGISSTIAFIPAENDPKISIHRSRHLRSFPSLSQNLLEKQKQTVGTGAKRESRRKGIKQVIVTNSHSSQSFAIISNASNRTGTHSVAPGHRDDLKNYFDWKRIDYLTSCSFRGKCLV
jgi:hypothetical protein